MELDDTAWSPRVSSSSTLDARADGEAWHPNDHFGLAHCVQELYVRDGTLLLPTAVDLPREEEAELERRTAVIVATIRHALGDDDQNEVQLRRWLPGCHVVDGAGRLEPIADAADRCRFLATNADGRLRRIVAELRVEVETHGRLVLSVERHLEDAPSYPIIHELHSFQLGVESRDLSLVVLSASILQAAS